MNLICSVVALAIGTTFLLGCSGNEHQESPTTENTSTNTADQASNEEAKLEPVYFPKGMATKIDNIDPIYFSQDLLYAVKTEGSVIPYLDTLASFEPSHLQDQLDTEDKKKAFWLNIYNSLIQIQLAQNSVIFQKDLKGFFHLRNFTICGYAMSMDDVEHRMLRRQLRNDELDTFAKPMMVAAVDYRVHFSINCGGKSCPAIAFYKPEILDEQLDNATTVFLKAETLYDEHENKVHLNQIFNWYAEDFGGEDGIRKLLMEHDLIPDGSTPTLAYKEFDWGMKAKKFASL